MDRFTRLSDHRPISLRGKACLNRSADFPVRHNARTAVSPTRVSICLAILLCGFTVLAAPVQRPKTAPPIPAPAEILSHLNKAHPRLLASDQDFAALKERVATDPKLKEWEADLQKQAERILQQPPSKYEIPDGLRLLATSRRVLGRVYTLALCYRLEGKKEYAARAWDELSAAADFQDWNPRHFLDTAEMTHAVAIGYDWLYHVWTREQREKLRQAMVKKGFEPALKVYRAQDWWVRAHHNWNQVCNGGMGMGALALADVEPELAGEILHDALESLPLAMAEFAPDGAWAEGPGYWNYATAYNVVFLAGLQTALGTDFGLSQMPGFAETGLFPMYLTGPFGRTFNYADGGDRSIRAPQMFWLARKFNQPVYAWYERQHASPAPRDLLWYEPEGNGPKAAELPLDKYFRKAEVVTLRSDWEDSKALFVGFKAGDNKANHSHLDLGSFVFDALGVRWAADLGADNYNLPGYFGSHRWEYYRLRAEGQNTLVINPGLGPDQDPKAATRIVQFGSTPERAFAIADLTPAYKGRAQHVWRGLALLDRDKLLVQDEIHSRVPADVWWFMHTPAAIQIEENGHTAMLQEAGAQLRAEVLSPQGARFQIMDAAPLPSSPHPERQAKNDRFRKLALRIPSVSNTRIAVLLTPAPKEGASAVSISPLSDW